MKQTKIAKAIAYTIAGTALTAASATSASASTTMYNKYEAFNVATPTDGQYDTANSQTHGPDGWVWGKGAVSGGDANAADPGWVGTSGPHTNAFGSTRAMPLNWAAHITQAGDDLEISQADSFSRYGIYADIDTAKGAWMQVNAGNGWLHNIDIGLFKSDVTQTVTLNISGLVHPEDNFGITVYKGLSSSDIEYSHHGPYFGNSGQNFEGAEHLLFTPRDPITGLTSNSLTFNATAGQIYTIVLGGNNGAEWNGFYDGYVLNISTPAAVPVPGAVWLFGSALTGFIGLRRRKPMLA